MNDRTDTRKRASRRVRAGGRPNEPVERVGPRRAEQRRVTGQVLRDVEPVAAGVCADRPEGDGGSNNRTHCSARSASTAALTTASGDLDSPPHHIILGSLEAVPGKMARHRLCGGPLDSWWNLCTEERKW
jgi:hypothetical protein